MPTIVLGQDEVDCFAAWVSAEAGLPEHADSGTDPKVNYGSLLLQALLEYWKPPPPHHHLQGVGSDLDSNGCDGDIRGNEYFSIPKHTPIIFSEVGGRNVCRLLVKDAVGETESALLSETVPSWVTNVVIERTIPKFIKLPFYLLAHPSMLKQDRSKKVSSISALSIFSKFTSPQIEQRAILVLVRILIAKNDGSALCFSFGCPRRTPSTTYVKLFSFCTPTTTTILILSRCTVKSLI